MEPPVPIIFEPRGPRPPGWQVQQRLDHAVNQVVQSHRGCPQDEVLAALHERLRGIGVPVSAHARQVRQYAEFIARLPPLPVSGA